MDSLTQITLGAAVGEAVAGRKAGTNAPLWGAFLGTLPDLDVLANPFLTEAQALAFHRGPSHSLFLTILLTPLIAYGLSRLHTDGPSWQRWSLMVGSVLLTHIGLDCLTSYGTQIFWPFSRTPAIIGSIFIIDPLYTVPLAAGLLGSLRWSPTARYRRWINYAGLALSSAYLLFTLGTKLYVNQVFDRALTAQQLSTAHVFTKPTPLNSVLWTAIAESDDGFYVGYYSILDSEHDIDFRYVPKNHHLLGEAADNPIIERLRWFSRGYFTVQETPDGTLTVQDLRFGRNDLGLTDSGKYIFTFHLRRDAQGTISGFTQKRPEMPLSWSLVRRFVDRIQGQPVSTAPIHSLSTDEKTL